MDVTSNQFEIAVNYNRVHYVLVSLIGHRSHEWESPAVYVVICISYVFMG